MKLFADTGGWVAVFDRSDPYHQLAQPAFVSLQTRDNLIYTSDYVIAETITFLVSHHSHQMAVKFGRAVQRSSNVQIEHIDLDLWHEAWDLFQRYDDKEFSFADCTSFVLMRQLKLRDVFGFDHHFTQMGFRLWPGMK
ncbi:MAG TPA: PIN domain-containing protein [Anaerolineae bacterium]|nr:PIN domain-containing protein [Anaerolineae bacterium]